MKIVFTGSGTGGHFYPNIAVAEEIHRLAAEQHLVAPALYYFAPAPYDAEALLENNIQFVKSPAGKMRRYMSLRNITDFFVTIWGTIWAFFTLLALYPDVVFSKGGYASVPTVLAAHVLGIPIVIHESDSKPGRANLLAAKYAAHIAVSFDDSVKYFPAKAQDKIARTGIPIRRELMRPAHDGAAQELGLDTTLPTVLILGGSSGSKRINEMVLEGLPDFVQFANVIHQTGKDNFAEAKATGAAILGSNPLAARYHVYPYLSQDSLRSAAGVANVIVSRAGATAITEISLWGRPAILVPIPEKISHDQRTNAYAYARTGAAVVLEEENMTPHILVSEVRRIAGDPALAAQMAAQGASFAVRDAATRIATELMRIASTHREGKKTPTKAT